MNIIPNPKKCELRVGTAKLKSKIKSSFDIDMADEAYILDISEKGIEIKAKNEVGLYHAKQTLKQIKVGKVGLQCLYIEDSPTFEYRSFMLDCVRHFFTVAEIKKVIEGISLFKINKFHWHLTDDQGWRIPIDKWERLTEIGSKRPFSNFGSTFDDKEHGGFYSKEEIRDVIDFCAKRHIDVVPGIEIPGHTSAMLCAYQEFSCKGDVQIKTRGGVYPDLICVGNENTYSFIQDILDEICELFPFHMIHIGGDETPKQRWKECPKCQQKIKESGLADENELQENFMNRIIEYLQTKGKIAIVWSDAFGNGGLNRNGIGQFWVGGKEEIVNHVNNGGKMIMSHVFEYYLDYAYGLTPVNKILKYNPVLKEISRKDGVIGVEAPLWTENVPDFKKLTYLAFPRIAAVSETGWNLVGNRDRKTFCKRFEALSGLLFDIGITPAPRKMWNIYGFGKVKDFIIFRKKAMTKQDFKDFIKRIRAQKKERKLQSKMKK